MNTFDMALIAVMAHQRAVTANTYSISNTCEHSSAYLGLRVGKNDYYNRLMARNRRQLIWKETETSKRDRDWDWDAFGTDMCADNSQQTEKQTKQKKQKSN